MNNTNTTGPGMSQGEARKRAKELGGIAVGARKSKSESGHWIIGGWSSQTEAWIVVDTTKTAILDDGANTAE
jgi:hypothetical protein